MNNVINPNQALRFTEAGTQVTLSASSARTAALSAGFYYLTSDVDCRFLQGGSDVTANASTSNRLWAKERVLVRVRGGGYEDDHIAAIAGGAGTLDISKARF